MEPIGADWEMNDMMQGYIDGRHPDNPEPSANRSHAYRHGFANGRDDLRGEPRAVAATLRERADEADRLDALARLPASGKE